MAVTVDAVSGSLIRNQVVDDTNTTASITIAAGASHVLVFLEASLSIGHSDASITFTTLSVGGSACTQVAGAIKHSGSDAGTTGFVDIYYLLNPSSGAQTVSITEHSGFGALGIHNLLAFAVSYLGGSGAPASVASGRANGNGVSSLTINDGELFTGIACNGSSAPTVTTGTSDGTATGDTSTASHGGIRVAHSAGAGSITFATNAADSSSATGVTLTAAAGGLVAAARNLVFVNLATAYNW
jgi:hypothetical protein